MTTSHPCPLCNQTMHEDNDMLFCLSAQCPVRDIDMCSHDLVLTVDLDTLSDTERAKLTCFYVY